MISIQAILLLGFFLGARHATDPDHVVAVATIVSRERTLRAAAPLGALWGLGHTVTILIVGGAIILGGIVIPPRVGLTMEFAVAIMLMLLGAWSVFGIVRQARALACSQVHEHPHALAENPARRATSGAVTSAYDIIRPLVVGVVHGLAGSAAVALLVLTTIRDPFWALAYLLVFGVGTIVGMLLITTAMAMPFIYAARRFARLHRTLGLATGILSLVFGGFLVYHIGFVDGLLTNNPQWSPE